MPTGDKPTSTSLSPLARFSLEFMTPGALYDDWLIAETKATLALEAWRTARSGAKGKAYATYVAALAYEEHAADLLAIRVRGPR